MIGANRLRRVIIRKDEQNIGPGILSKTSLNQKEKGKGQL
jgi:hypothetical protein